MSQNHLTQGIQETKVTLPIRRMKKAIVTVLFILLVLLILRIKFLFVGINLSLPENTGSQPPACQVASVDKLAEGDTPDISKDDTLIAYSKKVNSIFELFVMYSDGTNQHCITCDNSIPKEMVGKNKGKATFYADSRYLLAGVENEYGKNTLANQPGVGDDYDFWLIDLQTNTFTRLTNNPKGFALQYPRFSPDGKKLIWSERYKKGGIGNYLVGKGEFGWWRIKIADFSLTATGPRLDNIEELEPAGKGFYEPHGVSPDGSKLIFSGAVTSGKTQIYSDIYVYDLNNRKLSKLTSARNIHHEQALYSPSGNKISYMSGPFVGLSDFGYKADLYLMDENGNNRTRLTYFNDPENASYPGQTSQIDKDTWFSDGTAIVFGLYIHKINKFYIYKLTFNDSCGKL